MLVPSECSLNHSKLEAESPTPYLSVYIMPELFCPPGGSRGAYGREKEGSSLPFPHGKVLLKGACCVVKEPTSEWKDMVRLCLEFSRSKHFRHKDTIVLRMMIDHK